MLLFDRMVSILHTLDLVHKYSPLEAFVSCDLVVWRLRVGKISWRSFCLVTVASVGQGDEGEAEGTSLIIWIISYSSCFNR